MLLYAFITFPTTLSYSIKIYSIRGYLHISPKIITYIKSELNA